MEQTKHIWKPYKYYMFHEGEYYYYCKCVDCGEVEIKPFKVKQH